MPMTVADAITRARNDFLDDDGTRWPDAEARRHLQYALSNTFHEYVANGGLSFSEIADVTSTDSGVIDLSSEAPDQVHGVSMSIGPNSWVRIKASRTRNRAFLGSFGVRNFSVEYSRTPSVGTGTTSNPLITGAGGAQMPTWDAFENLVCLRAAMSMQIKDGVVPAALANEEQRLTRDVILKPNKPPETDLPEYGRWAGIYDSLRWYWDYSSQSVQLHRVSNANW